MNGDTRVLTLSRDEVDALTDLLVCAVSAASWVQRAVGVEDAEVALLRKILGRLEADPPGRPAISEPEGAAP